MAETSLSSVDFSGNTSALSSENIISRRGSFTFFSALKYLPLLLVQFLVVMSFISFMSTKFFFKPEISSSKTQLYTYKVDQCQELSAEEKEHRVSCCSDTTFPVLGGIDVVDLASQPLDSLPQLGSSKFQSFLTTSLGKYSFFFISLENKEKFDDNPWTYAPAYGGFCACGIAFEERFADPGYKDKLGPYVDLSKWTIRDGRLFFFSGPQPLASFLSQETTAVVEGDDHWAAYYDGHLYDGAFNTNCFHRQEYTDLVEGVENDFVCPEHHNNPNKVVKCGC